MPGPRESRDRTQTMGVHGITLCGRQMNVLMELDAIPGHQLSLKELEGLLHVAQSAAAGIVMRLEQKGFVDSFTEVGVNLTDGYNGHLTSREAGSVGGQMVKNVCPGRTKNMTVKSALLWDIYRLWCT